MKTSSRTGAVGSLLCSFLLLATPAAAAFQNDFSAYPTGAQSCLYAASDASKCDGETVATMNACLCSNGGNFVLSAAACIGKNSPKDVSQTYKIMAENCDGSDTHLEISQAQFIAAASGSATTSVPPKTTVKTVSGKPTTITSTPTPTRSPTPIITVTNGQTVTVTPTQSPDNGAASPGLSTGATIGIAVGGAAVGIALIAALAFFLVRRRKKAGMKEEARPMLDQYPPGAFGGREPSPRPSEFSNYYDPKHPPDNKSGWRPGSGFTPSPVPSPGSAPAGWHTPQQAYDAHQQWATGAAAQQHWHQPPTNYVELPPQAAAAQNPGVYELASIPIQQPSHLAPRQEAVEMPASPAVPGGGQPQHYPGQWRR